MGFETQETHADGIDLAVGDLGPLAWVLDELRKSLDTATKAVKRFVRDAEAARGSDLATIDTAALRIARQQVHASVGALNMVGLAGPAIMLGSMEQTVQAFVQRPERCNDAMSGHFERASFALIQYLEVTVAGKQLSTVSLFPQFKVLQEFLGAERIHPADLWEYESTSAGGRLSFEAQTLTATPALRAEMDRWVLNVVKSGDPTAALALRDRFISLSAGAEQPLDRLWAATAALFEAIAEGLLPLDTYAKRMPSRILSAFSQVLRGETSTHELLLRDLLFFCSQAQPSHDERVPILSAVRSHFGLGRFRPANYTAGQFGHFDPSILAQARKRVANAKDLWTSLSNGETAKRKQTLDQFSLVSESLIKLHPASQDLATCLMKAVETATASPSGPSAELALEVATSVLYLEAAFEDLDPTDPELERRTGRLAHRLESVRSGAHSEPLEPWIEDLYRNVSDRQTMGSVVGELRVSLNEVERCLDQFFRDPSLTTVLQPVPAQLQQMRGVLTVLGLADASAAVVRMRETVEGMLVTQVDPQQAAQAGTFEKLGNNLGALGFLIDMLGYQPSFAKRLFTFDAQSGELMPLMGRSDRTRTRLISDGNTIVRIASPQPAAESEAENVPPLPSQAAATQAITDQMPPQANREIASAALQPPSAVTSEDDDDGDDLRDIFLEEAREVVGNATVALDGLRNDPRNLADQTTIRRAFHTLKGSSRMVGLNDFGEAAWSMEQLYNAWLADPRPAPAPMLQLTADAVDHLSQWVEAISFDRPHTFAPESLRASADAWRLRGEFLPLPHQAQDLPTPSREDAHPEDPGVDVAGTSLSENSPQRSGLAGEVVEDTPEAAQPGATAPVAALEAILGQDFSLDLSAPPGVAEVLEEAKESTAQAADLDLSLDDLVEESPAEITPEPGLASNDFSPSDLATLESFSLGELNESIPSEPMDASLDLTSASIPGTPPSPWEEPQPAFASTNIQPADLSFEPESNQLGEDLLSDFVLDLSPADASANRPTDRSEPLAGDASSDGAPPAEMGSTAPLTVPESELGPEELAAFGFSGQEAQTVADESSQTLLDVTHSAFVADASSLQSAAPASQPAGLGAKDESEWLTFTTDPATDSSVLINVDLDDSNAALPLATTGESAPSPALISIDHVPQEESANSRLAEPASNAPTVSISPNSGPDVSTVESDAAPTWAPSTSGGIVTTAGLVAVGGLLSTFASDTPVQSTAAALTDSAASSSLDLIQEPPAASVSADTVSRGPVVVPFVDSIEDQIKVIGPLRIGIPLYNVYLNEADEWSRKLQDELGVWALDTSAPIPESSIAWSHSLAGSSGTVGFSALSDVARALEHALLLAQRAVNEPVHASSNLFNEAAYDIRRLLHQFAAGFLKEPKPGLLDALRAFQPPENDAPSTRGGLAEGWNLEDELQAAESESTVSTPAVPNHASDSTWVNVDGFTTGALPAPDTTAPLGFVADPNPEAKAQGFLPDLALEATLTASVTNTAAGESNGPYSFAVQQTSVETTVSAPLESPSELVSSVIASTVLTSPVQDLADEIDVQDAVDADLFPIFEEEAQELLPLLSGALRQWLERVDNQGARGDVLRALHTLKGSARLAGALRLGEMSHRMESQIEGFQGPFAHEIEPLIAEFDQLQVAFEALRNRDQAQYQQDASSGITSQDSASMVTTPPVMGAAALPAASIARPASAIVQPNQGHSVRVRAQLLDRMLNQTGEVMITRSRLENELAQLRGSLGDLTSNLERMRAQLREIELQAETQMQSRQQLAKASDVAFDPLEFDRFTRFQEITRSMAESVNDVATVQRNILRVVESTEDDLVAQARQTRDLQRDLLKTRMVEFEGISERLYRVVRQAGKDSGKQVKLDIIGGSIELDRGVLDRMTPAFEHLLRNCVAHGIESMDARTAAGKDASGNIVISLHQEGNDVAVAFADDGQGLNLQKIRAKAISQGLLGHDTEIDDDQAASLIFTPGFSTAEQVTELSGRGIGMDVVRAEVQSLGGRVETRTQAGLGTTFKMVLPLTTAVTQVVMLRMGKLSIGVPSNLVEIVRRATAKDLDAAYNAGTYTYGGEDLPFFWAGALLQSSARSTEPVGRSTPVVVFKSAAQRVALHVDEVLGNQEVVVKNLGQQLARLPGLAGMSVLASGAVVLIYNPVALSTVYGEQARTLSADRAQPEVLEQLTPAVDATESASLASQAEAQAAAAAGETLHSFAIPKPSRPKAEVPLVMVVDDSITVRRVTQRLLAREGYRVVLAADGLQALEKLQDEIPAVVLSDIEMPRMDGFDLARNIRMDNDFFNIPIIMITSRIAEKHKEHAAELGVNHYLGKPYAEDELLSLVRRYCFDEQPA